MHSDGPNIEALCCMHQILATIQTKHIGKSHLEHGVEQEGDHTNRVDGDHEGVEGASAAC